MVKTSKCSWVIFHIKFHRYLILLLDAGSVLEPRGHCYDWVARKHNELYDTKPTDEVLKVHMTRKISHSKNTLI